MTISRKAFFLSPSHSLEDFPTHLNGNNAAHLLDCWAVSWHPALLAVTEQATSMLRAGASSIEHPDSIIFVPPVANRYLEQKFLDQAREFNAILIHDESPETPSRTAWVDRLKTAVPEIDSVIHTLNDELISDFYALAYAYLQVQIMTRQLRYSSNLRQDVFDQYLVDAAKQAVSGDAQASTAALTSCFDLLMEERNNYYPVRPQLVDLVLLADSTLRADLDEELKSDHPQSLLITGEITTKLSAENPAALYRIKKRIEKRTEEGLDQSPITLVGGLQHELPDPLLSSESTWRQLTEGRACFHRLLRTEPKVYGRRQSGLNLLLPGILEPFNYLGAIHTTLDGGEVPTGKSPPIRWSGMDGASIPACNANLFDAADAGNFLRLGLSFGEQIDSVHEAVAIFAHWPDRCCDAFYDLINIHKYAPVLGHWVTCDDYFDSMYDPGYGEDYSPDDYRMPYLSQAVSSSQLDPVSRFVGYWKIHYRLLSVRSLLIRAALARPHASIQTMKQRITECESRMDEALLAADTNESQAILEESDSIIRELVQILQREPADAASANPASANGFTAINGLNFRRRTIVGSGPAKFTSYTQNENIIVADSSGEGSIWVLELPGNSATSIEPVSTHTWRGSRKPDIEILNGHSLRNEFFEVQVDAKSGGISSVMTWAKRSNLLSQQLAVRIPQKAGLPTANSADGDQAESQTGNAARYTQMKAETISGRKINRVQASITSEGKLIDGSQVIAQYRQTIEVTRGMPVIELRMELDTKIDWPPHPFFYLCNRIAWADESARPIANLQECRHPVSAEWIHATQTFHLDIGEEGVTLLTGGLPYHRRSSRRMLDSLLVVGKERCRDFRMGIGVKLAYPMLTAASRLTPAIVTDRPIRGIPGLSGDEPDWWLHFDRKNILVTWWDCEVNEAGQVNSLWIRCRETEGRAGELTIRSPVKFVSASLQTIENQFMRSLPLESGPPSQIVVSFAAYEYFQIEFQL